MEPDKNQISLPEVPRFEELRQSSPIADGTEPIPRGAAQDEFRLTELPPSIAFAIDTRTESVAKEPMPPSDEVFLEEIPAEAGKKGKEAEFFSLPKHFWRSLNSDAGIRSEIERIIEEEVQHRVARELDARFEVIKPKVIGEAKEEGFRTGHQSGFTQGRSEGLDCWKSGQQEVTTLKEKLSQLQADLSAEVSARLNHLIMEFLEQKERLLKEHEKSWSDALMHLLKRFMVKDHALIGSDIEHWLTESVADFANRKKIQVYLCEIEYERQKAIGPPGADDKWELMKDPTLRRGEVRYECGAGGIFFSGSAEYLKLQEILTKVCAEDMADVA